jgi:antitoxin component of RelBE/YafQ-DinJ toxin-antitoxin module
MTEQIRLRIDSRLAKEAGVVCREIGITPIREKAVKAISEVRTAFGRGTKNEERRTKHQERRTKHEERRTKNEFPLSAFHPPPDPCATTRA